MGSEPAPGTAALHARTQELYARMEDIYKRVEITATMLTDDCQRKRAMFLSWVDEMERDLGYGTPGMPPRTAQKNRYWREAGQPDLSDL